MNNVFTFQSMPLPDFARAPKGTVAVFFCDWDNLQLAQNRITGKFKHTSLPVNGSCTLKSFNAIDSDTGIGFKVIQATVIKPIPPRKKRGRKKSGTDMTRGLTPLPPSFTPPTIHDGKLR